MIRLSLALVLAVAGCGGPQTALTDQQACERQANEDPAVKELIIKGLGNPYVQATRQGELRAAKGDATIACLRARGVVRPGGVERQKA